MQMGSHMKNTIFEERIASGLRRWHQRAKKNRKKRNSASGFSSRGGTQSVETTPSHGSSPLHLMRRYNTMGDIETPDISPRYYHSEYNTMGDIETPDISPRYYHSKYGATESPSYSKATEEHPISKQIETSNLEMVASSAYPPQVIKDATEQHSISKDVNINSRDFSFDKF
jgi:mlo protein